MKNQFVFGCLISLILGGLIYIGLRPKTLIMFSWFETLNLDLVTDTIREVFQGSDMLYVPDWILYSLPGGLYMVSCVSLLMIIWRNTIDRHSAPWIFAVPILGILSEPLQHHSLFPGTHHFADYLLYIIGTLIPVFIYRNRETSSLQTHSKRNWKNYIQSIIAILFYFVLAFGADVVGSPLGDIVHKIMGSHWSGNL